MKLSTFLLLSLLLAPLANGQKLNTTKVQSKLSGSKYDTAYVKKKFGASIERQQLTKPIYNMGCPENLQDSIILSDLNALYGPFQEDGKLVFYKTVSIDSTQAARVGNIWLDQKRGLESAKKLGESIVEGVKNGKDFNMYCFLYSDGQNTKKDCDIGWFYASDMVASFSDEVFKHELGDVFLVGTKFGYHVVKILGQPRMERKTVHYLRISVPVE